MPRAKQVPTVLFIASLPDLRVPVHLGPAITESTQLAHKQIAVVLVSPWFNGGQPLSRRKPGAVPSGLSHAGNWEAVQKILTFAYVQATAAAHARDQILLDVDVILQGTDMGLNSTLLSDAQLLTLLEGDELPIQHAQQVDSLNTVTLPEAQVNPDVPEPDISYATPSLFPVVALGGTFDHLHAGHKILLTMAAWISSWKVIVGITDDTLLQKKANKHLIENFTQRSNRIRTFLDLVRPGLVLDLVSISDVAGPTGWDANIQALVVSQETAAGGAAIDKIREENNLPALRTFVIDVISAQETSVPGDDAEKLKVAKMSSTAIRQWIADNPDSTAP